MVDYYAAPGKLDWDNVNQTTIPDFPGVTFTYTPGQIYATIDDETEQPDKGHSILIGGMPIWNAFFSDLKLGGTYTLSWDEGGTPYVRKYKYLMKYDDTIPSYQSMKEPQGLTRYTLTNDNTISWDDLSRGLIRSQLGDYIDHYTIYTDKE